MWLVPVPGLQILCPRGYRGSVPLLHGVSAVPTTGPAGATANAPFGDDPPSTAAAHFTPDRAYSSHTDYAGHDLRVEYLHPSAPDAPLDNVRGAHSLRSRTPQIMGVVHHLRSGLLPRSVKVVLR